MLNIFDEVIRALKNGEPAQIQFGGALLKAVPTFINHEETGEPLVEVHLFSDGASGAIEGTLRMKIDTYERVVLKMEKMSPRIAMVQRHLLSRGGG